jgi:hypothetical protein
MVSDIGDRMVFVSSDPLPAVPIVGWGRGMVGFDEIGTIPAPGVTLPRLSFGPLEELNSVIALLSSDIYDAAGGGLPNPFQIDVRL